MKEKILITGGCGFIGSHLTEYLLKKKKRVLVFDQYNSNGDIGWLKYIKKTKNLDIILGDIRDYDSVFKVMHSCNKVVHLAALIGIPYSYRSPISYLKTNIEGTYNILEAAKFLKIKKTIITSTSEVYGSAQYTPIDEKHPLVGQSPYSASKIAADQLAISYIRSFDIPIVIARPFNVFGPRQSARAIIPTIILQILKGKKNINLGNLSTLRDFTFVEDTCRAFDTILSSKSNKKETYNIGNNRNISIGDLANLIATLMKKEIKINQVKLRKRKQTSEVNKLLCDNNLIFKDLKWMPKKSFVTGLKDTINWYKKNMNLYEDENYQI
tara:strand:+ start:26499 stop:27476 length:978 start_codon:yes stop_codon:yes gene_type:complete